ncbi:MAG: phosphatase PAP2-related protein [bacterium]
MRDIAQKHVVFWKDTTVLRRVVFGVLLLAIGMLSIYYSREYTSDHLGSVVPDIILDNVPVMRVGLIFFQGAFAFFLVLVGVLLWEPKYIPFTLETSSVFFLTRSVFMIMTHLSAPAVEYYTYTSRDHHVSTVLFTLSSGNDLFFSGHAGFPFLVALIFWKQKPLRYFFLVCSLIGSVAVLLGHLHYSIDVFSAFFIAYGVFEISKRIFKREHVFEESLETLKSLK